MSKVCVGLPVSKNFICKSMVEVSFINFPVLCLLIYNNTGEGGVGRGERSSTALHRSIFSVDAHF